MTTQQILAALRAWLAEQAPGLVPSSLSVAFLNCPTPLTLPIGPAVNDRAAPACTDDEKDCRGLSPVLLDVLAVLREAKRPMSRTLILEALAKQGKLWNERTVAGYLSQLVQDGTLENVTEGRHRGYRLPAEGEE